MVGILPLPAAHKQREVCKTDTFWLDVALNVLPHTIKELGTGADAVLAALDTLWTAPLHRPMTDLNVQYLPWPELCYSRIHRGTICGKDGGFGLGARLQPPFCKGGDLSNT